MDMSVTKLSVGRWDIRAVGCLRTAPPQPRCGLSRRPKDLVHVPFQEFPIRMIARSLRQGDPFAGVGIELFAVAEFIPQARADQQSILRVYSEVAAVVQGVHVGPQQQTVV